MNQYLYEAFTTKESDVAEAIKNLKRHLILELGAETLASACFVLKRCKKNNIPYNDAIQGLPSEVLELLPCVMRYVQLKSVM